LHVLWYAIFLLYHSRKFENSQLVFAFFYGNPVTIFLQEQETLFFILGKPTEMDSAKSLCSLPVFAVRQ